MPLPEPTKGHERDSRYNLAMGHIQNALVAAAKRDFARCLSELDHAKVALIAYKAQVEKDINGGKEERPN
jgi:hypothetical protein